MSTTAQFEAGVADFQSAPGWWRANPGSAGRLDAGVGAAGVGADLQVGPAIVPQATQSGERIAFIALVSFTVILLLSPQIYFPILGTMRIAFLAAGVAIGAHLLGQSGARHMARESHREITLAFALVGWAIITIPTSYWAAGSITVLTENYLKAVAFFWLIGSVVVTAAQLRLLSWALVVCGVPLALTGLSNYFSGKVLSTGVAGFHRIYGYAGGSGLVGNPNDLALMLNLIIPLAAALAMSTRSRFVRMLAFIAIALSVTAVIITFSRAGFLTLIATFVMFMVILIRRGRSAGTAVVLLVGALMVLPFLPSGYTERLSTITNVETDATGSAQGRWRDLQAAVGVIASNPIVGVGLGQNILAMNDYRGNEWTAVHNAYLQVGVDLGLPGLILFVWLHIACYRSARRVERECLQHPELLHLAQLAAGVQVALIAFGVAAMFHPIAYQFYFFTVGGLAVALKNACRTEVERLRLLAAQAA